MTFLVAWAAAGMCWVIIHQAGAALSPQLLWRARSLGLRRWRWARTVLIPETAEAAATALRSSLALAWIVVAVAESSGVFEKSSQLFWSEGLGYRLFHSLDAGNDPQLLATIVLFAVVGIIGDQLFSICWQLLSWTLRLVRRSQARRQITAFRAYSSDEEQPNDNRLPHLKEPATVRVADLTVGYGDRTIISGLSLEIPDGHTLSVIAPSGAGKTTLLRALGHVDGDDLHLRGIISVGGQQVRRSHLDIGLVLQDAPVFGHLTVWHHVGVGARVRARSRIERARICWELLETFGLANLADHDAGTLSGGERQRLALATALANEPRLLLLDEPFGALDAVTRRVMQDFYVNYIRGRVTAVFVTHDLAEALIVGNDVAIGLEKPSVIRLPPRDSTASWERDPQFADLRGKIWEMLASSQTAIS